MAIKLQLGSSTYALKVDPKEATELHYGVSVEGRNNICLCGCCQRQLNEKEDMWFVSETYEILCKECFEEYLSYNYPNLLHNNYLIG